jgi:hypothetical protein
MDFTKKARKGMDAAIRAGRGAELAGILNAIKRNPHPGQPFTSAPQKNKKIFDIRLPMNYFGIDWAFWPGGGIHSPWPFLTKK